MNYKEIPGTDGQYLITTSGEVYSLKVRGWKGRKCTFDKKRKLKPDIDRDGYHKVYLQLEDSITTYVHRLVLETFVGPCPEGMQCRHLDGNPSNNALGNLEWATPSENQRDRDRHGTRNSRSSKLLESSRLRRGIKRPNHSKIMKNKWQDPKYRERQKRNRDCTRIKKKIERFISEGGKLDLSPLMK